MSGEARTTVGCGGGRIQIGGLDGVPAAGQADRELAQESGIGRGRGPQVEPVARHPHEERRVAAGFERPESASPEAGLVFDRQRAWQRRGRARRDRAGVTEAVEAHAERLEQGVGAVERPGAALARDHDHRPAATPHRLHDETLARSGLPVAAAADQRTDQRIGTRAEHEHVALGRQLRRGVEADLALRDTQARGKEAAQLERRPRDRGGIGGPRGVGPARHLRLAGRGGLGRGERPGIHQDRHRRDDRRQRSGRAGERGAQRRRHEEHDPARGYEAARPFARSGHCGERGDPRSARQAPDVRSCASHSSSRTPPRLFGCRKAMR